MRSSTEVYLRNRASAGGSRDSSSKRKYSDTNRSSPVKPAALAELGAPGLHRQRREVQAGGPALRPLGQLGELARRRARLPRPPAAARPPARPAGGPPRRSRAPVRAPASGRAAAPALPCSRSRSASRPERTRTAPRARPDRTDWRRRADRRAPAPAGARAQPVRSRRAGRASTRSIPLGPTARRTPRAGPVRRGESRPRCSAGTPRRRRLGRRARPTRTDADRPRPTAQAASSCRTRRARPRSRRARVDAHSRAITSAFATVPGRASGAASLTSTRSKGTSARAIARPIATRDPLPDARFHPVGMRTTRRAGQRALHAQPTARIAFGRVSNHQE